MTAARSVAAIRRAVAVHAIPAAAEINEARAYTRQEVADLIGMSPQWVYDEFRKGALKGAYLGGKLRVRHVDLVAYLAERVE